MSGWQVVTLDEAERRRGWIPLREQLDVHAFGVNAWSVESAGGSVIPEHDERQTEQEEIYVIAEGSGRIKLDSEVRDLQQWDILRIGPGVMRNLEAGSDGITLIAFGAPIGEENDGDIVPGWWAS